MDSDSGLDSESKLLSLINDLLSDAVNFEDQLSKIISFIKSLDLESQPKPETEFMSLLIQIITLFNSMDLASQPKPVSNLISFFYKAFDPTNRDPAPSDVETSTLFNEIIALEPEPELISLSYKIITLYLYITLKDDNFIMVCPQAQVRLGEDNILHIDEEFRFENKCNKWECFRMHDKKIWIVEGKREGGASSPYFFCRGCNGENHERYEKVPVEINHHPLHPQHSLKLVLLEANGRERKCHCCDEHLSEVIYCCLECDYAMNISCV